MAEVSIPENLMRKVGHKMGIRDRDQIREFVTGQSLDGEEELAARKERVKVELGVDESALSDEKRRLLADLIDFAQTTSIEFQEAMQTIMKEYSENRGSRVFTDQMKRKMVEKGYDLPIFKILDGAKATEFLSHVDPEWPRNEEAFVLAFNLPKPLSRYWYRGGVDSWGEGGVEIGEDKVEWGHFYREVMPVIWDAVGFEECEGAINFVRINDYSQHDPKLYYYVWEVD